MGEIRFRIEKCVPRFIELNQTFTNISEFSIVSTKFCRGNDFVNTFSAISSLSAEEKKFLKTKELIDAKTPDEWISFLKKLKDVDASGDKTRKTFGGFGCLGLIIAFIGIILLGFGIGIFIIPIGILLAAVCYGIYFYLRSFDISASVISNTIVPLMMILREETKPDEKVKLRLDLRGFAKPEKLVKKNPTFASGVYHAVNESFYRDHWMDGETALADGTRLIWAIEDLVKNTQKSKRTPRGKYKSKTKNKTRCLLSMQIGMSKKRYALPEKLKQKNVEGVIRTKEADDYNWMSVNKLVRNVGEQALPPQEFVNSIASAYIRAVPAGGRKQ